MVDGLRSFQLEAVFEPAGRKNQGSAYRHFYVAQERKRFCRFKRIAIKYGAAAWINWFNASLMNRLY